MIRIVVVDDQELVRTGLRGLAEHDGDIVVAAEAANGAAGLQKVREHLPDVVMMDIRMPVMDGLDATARIMANPALAGVRVLILTTFDEDENVFDAIRLGAAGYLLKVAGLLGEPGHAQELDANFVGQDDGGLQHRVPVYGYQARSFQLLRHPEHPSLPRFY